METQDKKPRETFFGIDVVKDDSIDYRNLIAQMFMCPNLTPDHVVQYISMIEDDELTVEKLLETIDNEMFQTAVYNDNSDEVMYDKLKEWEEDFGPMTDADKKYLHDMFGFTEPVIQYTPKVEVNERQAFDSPKELASIVKQYVKGQDEAIDKLAVVFYMHYMSRKNHTKSIIRSVLTIGPTGSGKSEIYRRFGLLCNFPVLTANSCHFTPVGWKGPSLSDFVNQFKISKGLSDEDMEYLVVIIPEFDKIAHFNMRTDSDYDADQMRQIMQILDKGNQMVLENGIDPRSGTNQMNKLCTDNWLVVLDGAFAGLEEIVKKRLNINKSMGFSKGNTQENDNANLLQRVNRNDLVQWGFMQEMIGRINYICALNRLTKDVIYQILVEAKDNILQSYVEMSKLCNIDLQFTDNALQLIADDANNKPFGFRSVPYSAADIMIPIYYEYCGTTNTEEKQTVIIDEDYVRKQLNTR